MARRRRKAFPASTLTMVKVIDLRHLSKRRACVGLGRADAHLEIWGDTGRHREIRSGEIWGDLGRRACVGGLGVPMFISRDAAPMRAMSASSLGSTRERWPMAVSMTCRVRTPGEI